MTGRQTKADVILSMTGHGRGESRDKHSSVQVEVASVNRKQLDIRVNMPRELSILEPMIHDRVGDRVSRGAVSILVKTASTGGAGDMTFNESLARRYIKELRKAAKSLKLKDDLTIRSVLSLPDVIRISNTPSQKGLECLIRRALDSALDGMMQMRQKEGLALCRDIKSRLSVIAQKAVRIRGLSKGVCRRYRDALIERIKEAGAEIRSNDPQVLRELAMFADKADITEELVRLDSHFRQAADILNKGGAIGRTMDFLCQEIFREINTIGSKANDSAVSRIVVEFKAQLEAIREQVQNVE